MESFNNDIHDNTVDGAEYGIRITMGSSDNKVYDNVFNDISEGEVRQSSVRFKLLCSAI